MSDVTPGVETSEYRLTKYLAIASAVVFAVGAALETLQPVLGHTKGFGAALSIVSLLVALFKALGYDRARAAVKMAALAADARPSSPTLPPGTTTLTSFSATTDSTGTPPKSF